MAIIQLSASDVDRFWAKVERGSLTECWEWQASRSSGYGNVRTMSGYQKAHRVSYFLHTGDQPGDRVIRHRCDNPPCCNPHHLEPGTQADNMQDMMERGRQGTGHVKLQPEDVIEIFTRYWRDWAKSGELAEEYGVTAGYIPYIARGDVWEEVLGPLARIRERSDRFNNKFTQEVVREICLRYCRDGLSTTEIAAIYDVAPTSVGNIFNGKTWGDATADIREKYPVNRSRWKILNAEAVRDIYIRHVVDGESQKTLAEEYGLSRTMITQIKTGRTWAAETADLRERYGASADQSRKLNAELAREIYIAAIQPGADCLEIAQEYGVKRELIYSIRSGQRWGKATADLRPGFYQV